MREEMIDNLIFKRGERKVFENLRQNYIFSSSFYL